MPGLHRNLEDPYLIPDSNVLISLSGGRTSAYMLHKVIERNGKLPERVKVVFANTGREFPETLDFVARIESHFGQKVHWIEYDRKQKDPDKLIATDKTFVSYKIVDRESASMNGEPFEKAIESKGGHFLPNMFARYCTQQMKFLTIKRFLVKEFGWKEWAAAIGVRNDEGRRVKPGKDNRQANWYPLNDGIVSQIMVLRYWQNMPFDLDLHIRTPDKKNVLQGNCDCCFLKSEESLAMMCKLHPERFAWWEALEEKTGSYFNDKLKYKELREKVESLPDAVFEKDGFFCQTSGGECTGFDVEEQFDFFSEES